MQMTADDRCDGGLQTGPHNLAGIAVSYLEKRQDVLVDRSIEIAKLNGYAPFTTTIRAAWVSAVLSITECLGNYLAIAETDATGPMATLDYKSDPRFTRMRKIARQHRSLGITLPMYIGLFKHFRNLYVSMLEDLPAKFHPQVTNRVRDFFDETELSITADWTNSNENVRLRELQERARAMSLDKDRYFAVFESLRNPAFLLDKSQNLLNANKAAAELFLGDAEAGEIVYLRSMSERKSSLQTVIGQIKAAATEHDQSVWLETLNGTRCFDVRRRALHDAVENIKIGHVVLLNDVTQHRRAAELAQQSERGMSRFLATMSHEIRTPLHSVLGATELLRTADNDSADDFLDVIEAAGQTLLQTLNNVLDYSKCGNGPPPSRPIAIDLKHTLGEFERIATVRRTRSTSHLDFNVVPELPAAIKIDWAMTQQVLSNLVSNAMRVDDGRGVRVNVSEATGKGGGTLLRFEIRDHGPGLSADDGEALFRPFERTSARDTGNGGTGLGLAIAHHLVQAMGGEIGYENRDVGALLWFELPFEVCAAPVAKNEGISPSVEALPHFARRCLLVDDDPIGSTVTKRLLERLGFQVDLAASVHDANRLARSSEYAVFVVDYILPDGDGPSLVDKLRQNARAQARYVALTANVEALEGNNDLSQRFHRILAKPADLQTLSAALLVPAQSSGSTASTGKAAPKGNLDGLTHDTVRAMTEAFQDAWNEFRSDITSGNDKRKLGRQAHRLAGSSAILGLHELETPLRELERRCQEPAGDTEIEPLVGRLDLDLPKLATWVELRKSVGFS